MLARTLILSLLVSIPGIVHAEVLTVRSGGGDISMLIGPLQGPFLSDFTSADFTAARTGPSANLTTPHPAWVPSLPADPQAVWINDTGSPEEGSSILYAIPFTLTQPFTEAQLQLYYAVDNRLGQDFARTGVDRAGIYFNELPVPATYGLGNLEQQWSFSADVTDLVAPGPNVMYIYQHDEAGPGGLIFSATIATEEQPPTAAKAATWSSVKAMFR